MKHKTITILFIAICLLAVAAYNSVYFEKLDEKRQRELIKNSSPKELVAFFWKNKLNETLKTAVSLRLVDSLLNRNMQSLVKQYGKTQGIGSSYCFLVKGSAKANRQADDKLSFSIGTRQYNLLIANIFSNTARDASGFFKIENFENTMDFNTISSELNTLIANDVIGSKFSSAAKTFTIQFVGATEINTENKDINELDITPLNIQIINE